MPCFAVLYSSFSSCTVGSIIFSFGISFVFAMQLGLSFFLLVFLLLSNISCFLCKRCVVVTEDHFVYAGADDNP